MKGEKIGLFICHCGTNISGKVNTKNLIERLSREEGLLIFDYPYLCSEPGQGLIKEKMEKENPSRVVIAACSPFLHKKTFQEAVKEAGLNPYLFCHANIREQCSWVCENIGEATDKAEKIILASLKRVLYQKPLLTKKVKITPRALVIGGGIAGIESAFQIAHSGKEVYLIEKEVSLGGNMARLDKTFPTLDCSACILTPKMVEVRENKNIKIYTNSEVKEISGFIGNFKVKVKKNPRYILLDKCTACDECSKVCPVEVDDEFNAGLNRRKAIYRLFPQAVPSAFAISKLGWSPCRNFCPAGINVQAYIALANKAKYKEALEIILKENPLAGVSSRVCHRPCEDKCLRKEIDEAVAINAIKRFLVDNLDYPLVKIKEERKDKVAVVGSGPAGLSCAYQLRMAGYKVTVFEALSRAGGMLNLIPEYRLPKWVLDKDIQRLKNMGIEIRLNSKIKELRDLKQQGYQAIFIATGTPRDLRLGIEGEELQGVVPALEFLNKVSSKEKIEVANKVVVIGGGNVAIDCARSVLRLGARQVNILYRRSRREMPAIPEEVREAEKEGVRLNFLTSPKKILGEDGKVRGLECLKMKLSEVNETGRPKPILIEDSEFIIDAEMVITAIGEITDIDYFGLKKNSEGALMVAPLTYETSQVGVFAGGDVTGGEKFVLSAIKEAKEAALSIQRYLEGKDLREERLKEEIKMVGKEDVIKGEIPKTPRVKMLRLSPQERTRNFLETETRFSQEMLKEETGRCLNCSICCECGECEKVCEPEAIKQDMKEENLELDIGSIIVATGFSLFSAEKIYPYGYKRLPNVFTSIEIERMLSPGGPTAGEIFLKDGLIPEEVAIIHCVGSRDENYHPYCSVVCCLYSLKLAHLIKEKTNAKIYNFYIDLRLTRKGGEEFYNRVLEEGVEFIRGKPARIDKDRNGKLIVECEDTLLGKIRKIPVDMVILSTALEPGRSSFEMTRILGLSLSEDGFFKEKHPKLAPVSTMTEGIYIAGTCQAPKDISESVSQAGFAAAEVISLIDRGEIEIPTLIAEINEETCSGCGICLELCPYKALEFDTLKNKVKVVEEKCQGCGLCASGCPSGACSLKNYSDKEILAEIEGIL